MVARSFARMNTERASKNQMSSGLTVGLSFILGGLVIMFLAPSSSGFTSLERVNYLVLTIAYCVFAFLVTLAVARQNLTVFEPLTLVTVLMMCSFVLYPLRDVLMHDMISHGKDVSTGCIKATTIVTVSYAFMYVFYYTGKDRAQLGVSGKRNDSHTTNETRKQNVTLMLAVWALSFVASVSVMLQSGMSISYLFSLGLRGEYVISEGRTLLLFLSNFGISLVTAWLFLLFNARSMPLKLLLTILTLLYAFARMSRWLILVVLVSPVVYYFSKTRRRVSKRSAFVVALVFVVIAAWMQLYRYGFRRGTIEGFSFKWDFATLMGPFRIDFTTYKAFYGMVQAIPMTHGYFLGKSTLLYFFTMMIPRALWAGKPLRAPVSEIVSLAVNTSASSAGMAFYNVGEYYADFGPLGSFILMSLFGYLLGRFLEPKRESLDVSDILAFAIMYPLLFQWTARGNTGTNAWLTIFAMFPVVLLRVWETGKHE